jgi:hypothetical protein
MSRLIFRRLIFREQKTGSLPRVATITSGHNEGAA